jgi:hypothetical protein
LAATGICFFCGATGICFFCGATGISALVRRPKPGQPTPSRAPRVALPVKGQQPFRPLRSSRVNPCRGRQWV